MRLRDPVSGVEALYPPGGGVEPNEPPAETARRETLEETGVRVRVDPSIVFVDEYPFTWAGVDYAVTTHYFYAVPEEPPAELEEVVDADYNLGAVWMPTDEALRSAGAPGPAGASEHALAIHPAIAPAVERVLQLARTLTT